MFVSRWNCDGRRLHAVLTIVRCLLVLVGIWPENCHGDSVCTAKSLSWNSQAGARFGLSINLREADGSNCGLTDEESLQMYLAAQWVTDRLNRDNGQGSYVPGVKIGFDLLDDCNSLTRAVHQALGFADCRDSYNTSSDLRLVVANAYNCNLYGTGSTMYCSDGCCGSSCCSTNYYYYGDDYDIALFISVIVLCALLSTALLIGCICFIVRYARKRRSANQPSAVWALGTNPGQVPVSQIGYNNPALPAVPYNPGQVPMSQIGYNNPALPAVPCKPGQVPVSQTGYNNPPLPAVPYNPGQVPVSQTGYNNPSYQQYPANQGSTDAPQPGPDRARPLPSNRNFGNVYEPLRVGQTR